MGEPNCYVIAMTFVNPVRQSGEKIYFRQIKIGDSEKELLCILAMTSYLCVQPSMSDYWKLNRVVPEL